MVVGGGIETAGLWSLKNVDADSVNLILLEFLVVNRLLNSPSLVCAVWLGYLH